MPGSLIINKYMLSLKHQDRAERVAKYMIGNTICLFIHGPMTRTN